VRSIEQGVLDGLRFAVQGRGLDVIAGFAPQPSQVPGGSPVLV